MDWICHYVSLDIVLFLTILDVMALRQLPPTATGRSFVRSVEDLYNLKRYPELKIFKWMEAC